jgi:hypothetical protein
MLQGKGSVDSCCAVGAAAAPKLASAFAAIKSPAGIPEAERPAGTMVGSGACHRVADRHRMGADAPVHDPAFRRPVLSLVVKRHIDVSRSAMAGGL